MDPDDEATLPQDLRAFLQACIESIEQVELLMMLRGSERLRTVREIAADLRITPAVARREVETLTARACSKRRSPRKRCTATGRTRANCRGAAISWRSITSRRGC